MLDDLTHSAERHVYIGSKGAAPVFLSEFPEFGAGRGRKILQDIEILQRCPREVAIQVPSGLVQPSQYIGRSYRFASPAGVQILPDSVDPT